MLRYREHKTVESIIRKNIHKIKFQPRRYLVREKGKIKGFTQKYNCHDLLYFEEFKDVDDAISREKEIKAWRREKKDRLIATTNPGKRDLAIELEWI